MADPRRKVKARELRASLLALEDWIHEVRTELGALNDSEIVGHLRRSDLDEAGAHSCWRRGPGDPVARRRIFPAATGPEKCWPVPGIIPQPDVNCFRASRSRRRSRVQGADLEREHTRIGVELELCRRIVSRMQAPKPAGAKQR